MRLQFRDRYVARLMDAADKGDLAEADRLLALAGALDATKSLSADHTIPVAAKTSQFAPYPLESVRPYS